MSAASSWPYNPTNPFAVKLAQISALAQQLDDAFRTAFGTIALSSSRFHRCRCQPGATRTFSPLNLLLTQRMAPELLYLETRWAATVHLRYDIFISLLSNAESVYILFIVNTMNVTFESNVTGRH